MITSLLSKLKHLIFFFSISENYKRKQFIHIYILHNKKRVRNAAIDLSILEELALILNYNVFYDFGHINI